MLDNINIETFTKNFDNIKNKWHKSLRKGDTGVGYTLETLVGIKENCLALPDIIDYELKVMRKDSNSLQSLFTKEPLWQIPQKEFIEKFGYPHTKYEGELSGNMTVSNTKNKHGVFLQLNKNFVEIKYENLLIASWNIDTLNQVFQKKFPNCVKVTAQSKMCNGEEYFLYEDFAIHKKSDKNNLVKFLTNGKVVVDFRMKTQFRKNKGIRNHGTCFRMKQNLLRELLS